jgi:YesN/AraC family two-component response regulator
MLVRSAEPTPFGAAMIRVLVADDEPLIRAGIKLILSSAGDIDVVAEAGNGREAVDAVQHRRLRGT